MPSIPCAALEAERDRLQAELDAAHRETEHLTGTQCKHPSAAVDGSHCHACGTDIW